MSNKNEKLLFSIPVNIFDEMVEKGIHEHLLNEYEYGGIEGAIEFLKSHDVDTSFLNNLKT